MGIGVEEVKEGGRQCGIHNSFAMIVYHHFHIIIVSSFLIQQFNKKETQHGTSTHNNPSPNLYLQSSSPSPSPSDELRIVLYCELRLFSIRKKLPTAKIVLRWRLKMPW